MSAVASISTSSASASYATQLAQTSALRRSLNNLGVAIQKGDLTSAGSILTAIIKANPQYATAASKVSQSQDPINLDFQTLADAISNHQVDAAKNAWTQIKSDLKQDGVTDISNGAAATAKLLAQTKASISQQIVSNAFGAGSGGPAAISFPGGGLALSGAASLSSTLIGNWLTYREGGSTLPIVAASTGSNLNTAA